MNFRRALPVYFAIAVFITACAHKQVATTPTPVKPIVATNAPPIIAPAIAPAVIATAPVYVPDITHSGEPLPESVFAWDGLNKAVDAGAEQDFARFTFSFTNTTQGNVTILNVHPGCSCTVAELPPMPWTIPTGGTGMIKLTVDLSGKVGTLFKYADVATDKGSKRLMMRINIAPPAQIKMTGAQRAAGQARAKVDRQAVFKGDCASCHSKGLTGKYGQQLFQAACGICHEADPRASMVPDLNKLTAATSVDFWRTWITYGKPGSLMPAFATSQGGPLSDIQIASLAQYLNAIHPSRATLPLQ